MLGRWQGKGSNPYFRNLLIPFTRVQCALCPGVVRPQLTFRKRVYRWRVFVMVCVCRGAWGRGGMGRNRVIGRRRREGIIDVPARPCPCMCSLPFPPKPTAWWPRQLWPPFTGDNPSSLGQPSAGCHSSQINPQQQFMASSSANGNCQLRNWTRHALFLVLLPPPGRAFWFKQLDFSLPKQRSANPVRLWKKQENLWQSLNVMFNRCRFTPWDLLPFFFTDPLYYYAQDQWVFSLFPRTIHEALIRGGMPLFYTAW